MDHLRQKWPNSLRPCTPRKTMPEEPGPGPASPRLYVIVNACACNSIETSTVYELLIRIPLSSLQFCRTRLTGNSKSTRQDRHHPMTTQTTVTRSSGERAGDRILAVVEDLRQLAGGNGERVQLQRQAIMAFVVRLASAAILYLSQIVLARWMGGAEYGVYVFVWTCVLVLGGISHLGLNTAMIRLLPHYQETGQIDRLRGLLRGGRLLAVVLGTVFAGLGYGGLVLLGDRIACPYTLPLYLALVCVPFYALTDVQDGIGRGRGWMAIALLPPYVLRPLLVLTAMIAAQAAGLPMQAHTAVAAAIFATWATAMVQLLLIDIQVRREISPGPRSYAVRDWLGTSLPLLVIGFCEIILQNADLLIISRYLSPADVGIYFAASKTMSLVLFVHYAVGSAAANRFAALHARGDQAALHPLVIDAVKWTFWPSVAAAGGLLALGLPLLSLFGPQFTDGYAVMLVLVIGFLARASIGPSEFLLNMMGQQKLCAAILVTTATLSITMSFVLVPRFGMIGAAAATSLALITAALLNYAVARRKLGLDISIFSVMQRPKAVVGNPAVPS